jgi:tetratricopeptide (TPR) repeat protein
MQPAALLAASVLASAAVAFAVVTLAAPKPQELAPADPDLAQRVAALVGKVEEQQKTIDRMAHQAAPAEGPVRSSVPSIGEAAVEAAVLSWLEKHAADAAPGSVAEAAAKLAKPVKAPAGPVDVRGLFVELGKLSGSDWNKAQELWVKAKDAGQLEALMAMYEQAAKDNPSVADTQASLGSAYLQALNATKSTGPEAGKWANLADKSFDRALEIDQGHWGARFQKALSLSFWPDFLGRKKEAIDNFEILVKQQESTGNVQPRGHETYLTLGNLYSQQGKDDKAKDIWERGARAFPDNQDLKGKLAPKK